MSDESESQGSQVIARAASLLRALEDQPRGLSISALAKLTGLPRTTVHRLVNSLESQQLLLQGDSGVQLGPALSRLAASAHTDIIALSRPAMETLGRRTRETVDLCVFRGTHAISVSQYVSDHELRVVSAIGTAFPCHCTAHGKAMLAQFDDARVLTLLGDLLESRTDKTLRQPDSVLNALQIIRQQGYAVDREEHARGVCGIGVNLETHLNEQYALSVAVPVMRFDESFEFLLSSLMQCKAEIESLLHA